MMQVFGKIYDYRRSDSWATNIRKERLNLFKSLVTTLPTPIKLLDVGGRVDYWDRAGYLSGNFEKIKITVLNLSIEEIGTDHPSINKIIGDARSMKQFQANEFDVVFSNSVIEHLGDYEAQHQMANEIMRVGKKYFVQTPNLFFPIEPHFVFPLFQFLPVAVRVWLVTHFALGWYGKIADQQKARELVTEIKLLSKKEVVNLFVGAKLYEEKFLGLTKSLIVYDGWGTLLSDKDKT